MADDRRLDAVPAWQMISAVPASQRVESGEPLVSVVFKGRGMCRVAAAESQQMYCFTANDPEQMIDAKDAEALLKTGLFRIGS